MSDEKSANSPNAGTSLVKLIVLGAIVFLIWKYGIPLSQKATEALEGSDEKMESVEAEADLPKEETAVPKSNARITKGYDAWEKDGLTTKEKPMNLGQDGFDDRFIFRKGDKEFIVYPPQP